MSEIAGQHVLITGGASGIGRLMAQKFVALGGRVSLWDIHRENLDKTVAELNATARQPVRGYLCDVSKRAVVYRVAEEMQAAAGAVDILVNNAGVVSGARLLDLADEKIEATMAINTLSLFWTAKAFLPRMIERNHGHVVTIASAAGLIGVAKLTDYATSKWAAVGFDESLRAELRQIAPGVKTTIVCPYFINTGMFHGVKTRFSWLLPILEEDDVASRIVSAIRRGKRRLWVPPFVYTIPPMRLLPVAVFDWLATFFGVNASMDEFKGRG